MTTPTIVGIDFETSGSAADSACAIGLVRMQQGVVQDQFYSLIRPPSSNVRFTEVHGLTWEMLKDAPIFADLWPQITQFIAPADYFVAHNAVFDRKVLHGCCARAHVSVPQIPFFCTLTGARRSLPAGMPKNLNSVCQYFGIPLQHHHAGSDAYATAMIYYKLQEGGCDVQRICSLAPHKNTTTQL